MTGAHGSVAAEHRSKLVAVLAITSVVLVAEVIGGLVSGSLALLADAGHMFTDVAGIALALFAIHFAGRPADDSRTYGFYRLEILAAVLNAVLLFGVAGWVLFEAWRRLPDPPEIQGGLMLAVALLGTAANVVSMRVLRPAQAESLARELVGGDVIPDVAGFRGLGQQVPDHLAKQLLRPDDLFVPMQERGEFGVVVPDHHGQEHSEESDASAVAEESHAPVMHVGKRALHAAGTG